MVLLYVFFLLQSLKSTVYSFDAWHSRKPMWDCPMGLKAHWCHLLWVFSGLVCECCLICKGCSTVSNTSYTLWMSFSIFEPDPDDAWATFMPLTQQTSSNLLKKKNWRSVSARWLSVSVCQEPSSPSHNIYIEVGELISMFPDRAVLVKIYGPFHAPISFSR